MGRRIAISGMIHHGLNINWFRSLNPDLTQEKLSELTGIAQQNISKFEGQAIIPDETLQKFADAFEISIKYLKERVCYTGAYSSVCLTYDQSQLFKDHSKQEIHNPIELMKQTYDENIAHLIEAHDKTTNILQKQVIDLKDEIKDLRSK
ncbi:MAG: helix-turn-helix domain-containing protein [Tannerellaceae bacterium]|nr:helix-turn-helix domain-containing protein [Tannerellaceae bacterium]